MEFRGTPSTVSTDTRENVYNVQFAAVDKTVMTFGCAGLGRRRSLSVVRAVYESARLGMPVEL